MDRLKPFNPLTVCYVVEHRKIKYVPINGIILYLVNMSETLHIYSRVSSRVQATEGTSLDKQLEMGIDVANRHSMEWKHWDEGAASSDNDDIAERPVLLELMGQVETGSAKHIFVYEQDRLSRTDVVASAIRDMFSKNEVKLYDCNGVYDYGNKNDLLFRQVRDAISQFENTQRVQRSKDGKIRRARQGGWIGGPAPYGYSNDRTNKVLAIDEEQAKWVRKIYQWYADGMYPSGIQLELLKNDVKTKQSKDRWSIGSISAILRNDFYLGEFDFKGIKIDIPPLMDKELFDRCKSRRSRQTKSHNVDSAVKHFYLLRGLLVCGHCGKPLGGMTQTYGSKQRRYYYCRWKESRWRLEPEAAEYNRHRGCQMNRSLLVDPTDKFVWDTVVDVLRESRLKREEFKVEQLAKIQQNRQGSRREVKRLSTRLRKLHRQEEQFHEALLTAEIEARTSQKNVPRHSLILQRLEGELEKVRADIFEANTLLAALNDDRDWVDWYKKFHRQLDSIESMENVQKQDFLKTIISKIEVSLDVEKKNHTLDIHFELPIVGDAIEWRNTAKKRDGYDLQGGEHIASLTIQKKTLVGAWREA